jgi:hypothetical protein
MLTAKRRDSVQNFPCTHLDNRQVGHPTMHGLPCYPFGLRPLVRRWHGGGIPTGMSWVGCCMDLQLVASDGAIRTCQPDRPYLLWLVCDRLWWWTTTDLLRVTAAQPEAYFGPTCLDMVAECDWWVVAYQLHFSRSRVSLLCRRLTSYESLISW